MTQARMRQVYLAAVVAVGLVVGLGGSTFAQSGNSELGSWKLNLAKSTYAAGTAPTSSAIKIEVVGGSIRNTVDSVESNGTVRHYSFTGSYDGKDVPVIGNSANGDTIARTRVDANTVSSVNKKGGQVSVTQTSVVSADGKTRTITSTGTDAGGQAVKRVAVYDRQ